MKPKLALAALLVLVTVGASGQEPKPLTQDDNSGLRYGVSCSGTCPHEMCSYFDSKTGEWSKPKPFHCQTLVASPNEGASWTQSPGESYMRACGHQKWCFSFNGGPELSADELADRAKMLERITALEKRVDELEAWKKNLHLEIWNPSVGKPKCCTINSDPEISTVKP